MGTTHSDTIEALIASALSSEGLASPSMDFGRRLESRLRLAGMIRQERRRVRLCLCFAAALAVSALGALAVAAAILEPQILAARDIPGILGHVDSLIVSHDVTWARVPTMTAGCLLAVAALSAMVYWLPWRRLSQDKSTRLRQPV